eukprot:1186945-Pleurochrysis_carterae.AAC.1
MSSDAKRPSSRRSKPKKGEHVIVHGRQRAHLQCRNVRRGRVAKLAAHAGFGRRAAVRDCTRLQRRLPQ